MMSLRFPGRERERDIERAPQRTPHRSPHNSTRISGLESDARENVSTDA